MHAQASYAPAKKSLGQNFLQDKNIAAKIVAALELAPDETLIEIGPGRGALLKSVLEAKPARYLALEKDADLARQLKLTAPACEVVICDALDFAWEGLSEIEKLKIVGNLPYNVASPLMWEICSRTPNLSRAVFMIQHEVALRVTAAPGGRAYGALSVWLNNFVTPQYLFKVGPGVFQPRPKVDSAVISLSQRRKRAVADPDLPAFKALIKLCFSLRRKQIRNILRAYWNDELSALLMEQGHGPASRPEELSCESFARLASWLKNSPGFLTSG